MKMNKTVLTMIAMLTAMPLVNQISSQDWANLKFYENANANLELPAKGENRVVFMGNSITEKWVRYDSTFFTSNPYIGRGISGQVTSQMLRRFRPDVIDLHPKVVVILAGTNDIAENKGPITLDQIAGNIFSMAELAKANNIKVVLASALPAISYSWRPVIEPADKIITLPPAPAVSCPPRPASRTRHLRRTVSAIFPIHPARIRSEQLPARC